MSHGNSNNTKGKSKVDRLNAFLARLMGKKQSQTTLLKSAPKPPASDAKFTLIVIFMLGFLWLLTGVYYVPQDTYGLILDGGRVTKVIKGLAVGISKPYPFSSSTLIDSSYNTLAIGKDENQFVVISSDEHNLRLGIDVGYKIVDPKLYYTKFYQEIYDGDERIKWVVMSSFENYMHSLSSTHIFDMSKVILANEASVDAKLQLRNYGIEITKLNVNNLQELPVNPDLSESSITSTNQMKITQAIISEAQNYAYNKQLSTESLSSEFNSLQSQYKTNPKTIRELLYYKMLSTVPTEQKQYKLLNLTESEFVALAKSGNLQEESSQSISTNVRERRFSRAVDRERVFGGQN